LSVIGIGSLHLLGFEDGPDQIDEKGQSDQSDDDIRHGSDPLAGVGEELAQTEKQEDHEEKDEVDHGRQALSET
jgi:hypothetical protein